MKIAFAASEAAPFLKTGGLGDVAQALPAALSQLPDCEVALILPYHGAIKHNGAIRTEFVTSFAVNLAWRRCHVGLFRLKSRKKRLQVYFVDNEQYFDRTRIYGERDDGERYAFFCKAALACLAAVSFRPDVIHCNDWQTALIPMLLHSEYAGTFPEAKCVFTIHNVEYQGWADDCFNMDVLGLPAEYTDVLRFGNGANFMKAAIVMADAVTTVSETYAEELRYPYYSHGMDSVLRQYGYKLSGIVNGIDEASCDPAGKNVPTPYTSDTAETGKRACKAALQREVGLQEDGDTALLAMVTRLASHKGIDLLAYIADRLMQRRVQLVVLGTGEQQYEDFLRTMQVRYPGRVAALMQFNSKLADHIYSAADIYLMPSKSEPCGLSQLIAMRFGAVPVVNAVGGLKDTVSPYEGDTGRGFTFQSYNGDDFLAAIDRALAVYYDMPEAWKALRKRDMELDLSWRAPARRYLELYRNLTGK